MALYGKSSVSHEVNHRAQAPNKIKHVGQETQPQSYLGVTQSSAPVEPHGTEACTLQLHMECG